MTRREPEDNTNDPEAVAWRADQRRHRAPLPRNLDEALARLQQLDGQLWGLTTINAPRPVFIDAETLIRCLWADDVEHRWLPHIEALFDEVHELVLHRYVNEALVTFKQLQRARLLWCGDDWLDRRARDEEGLKRRPDTPKHAYEPR